MKISWSTKGSFRSLKPFHRLVRTRNAFPSMSSQRLSSLMSSDLSNSLLQPATSGSLCLTSKAIIKSVSITVIPGLIPFEVKRIYLAKCKDLGIFYNRDQEERFYNFCRKSFSNRTMDFKENGLGSESMKVISNILKNNTYFCRLNLSKNIIGEKGLNYLIKCLKLNTSIVSVDLSNNNISIEGSLNFFSILQENEYMISINFSSSEALHRNRIGIQGAIAVSKYLQTNKILTHLNISDTSIGKEGFENIIKGIANNKILIFLDISYNCIIFNSLDSFCQALITTNLQELNISGNKIKNKACQSLNKMLSNKLEKSCILTKLNLSLCGISSVGAMIIFESLQNNASIVELIFDCNDIGIQTGGHIGKCIHINGTLKFLSLNNCNLKDENLSKICEGLCLNIALQKLGLCNNSISNLGAFSIADMLMKNDKLLFLDLSHNIIKNKGGVAIAKALRKNCTIEKLSFTENSFKSATGKLLSEVARSKKNLLKIDLLRNEINLKYVKEIKGNLLKNNFSYKALFSPKLRIENEKLAKGEYKVQEAERKIQEKIREKNQVQKKINKQILKLQTTIYEENEKYREVKDELMRIRREREEITKELEELFYEISNAKYHGGKEIEEYQDKILFIENDIRRLEKQKIEIKEKFRVIRPQIVSEIETLTYIKNYAEFDREAQLSSLIADRDRVRSIKEDIILIKNPKVSKELKNLIKKKKTKLQSPLKLPTKIKQK
ncbi:hypothetical protein SteCoe_32761 [Stentor coeruleus]|uniref:Uncharacterized protein n=1 Tax=Stentor coeruleus TaxID=5963 RepID=A0A1R2AYC5_9CILI|nr:hypothetical protein SteCoe_32761 [Stentor coeruleus]